LGEKIAGAVHTLRVEELPCAVLIFDGTSSFFKRNQSDRLKASGTRKSHRALPEFALAELNPMLGKF
jgi:hypothetical protein